MGQSRRAGGRGDLFHRGTVPTVELDEGTVEVGRQVRKRRAICLRANTDHDICLEIEGQKSGA